MSLEGEKRGRRSEVEGAKSTGGGMDHCRGIQYQGISGKLRSLPRWVQYLQYQ